MKETPFFAMVTTPCLNTYRCAEGAEVEDKVSVDLAYLDQLHSGEGEGQHFRGGDLTGRCQRGTGNGENPGDEGLYWGGSGTPLQ
jgi:hypothetical protein